MLGAMPRISQPDGLGELLDKQLSVVSRGQLLALGMTDRAMQHRVRAGGPWQPLLPGVYLGVSGAPSQPQKEMAALLYAGPGSLITGPVALHHREVMHRFALLPWVTKTGSLPLGGGCGPARAGICGGGGVRWPGRKVHSGGVLPVVTVHVWTVGGRQRV